MKRYYTSDDGYIEHDTWQPECWINIECPTVSDFDYLRTRMGVPETFLESVTDPDERPRFDREDDWLLTILRIPTRLADDPQSKYTTLTLGIITKDDIIVTICHEKTEMLDDYIEYTRHKHIKVESRPDFILRLVFSATYWYQRYLQEINNTAADAAGTPERGVRNDDLFTLMHQQKALVYFNTSLRGNEILVERIDKMFEDDCDPELLEDVQIELQQALNTVDVYIDILESTADTLASVISNNVNQIMKRMTSVSIILMLPTLIASFYGMNVAVAFGQSPYAFWGIIIFSMVFAAIIYLWLRKIKWF